MKRKDVEKLIYILIGDENKVKINRDDMKILVNKVKKNNDAHQVKK